jgi:hypothetical protein
MDFRIRITFPAAKTSITACVYLRNFVHFLAYIKMDNSSVMDWVNLVESYKFLNQTLNEGDFTINNQPLAANGLDELGHLGLDWGILDKYGVGGEANLNQQQDKVPWEESDPIAPTGCCLCRKKVDAISR